MVHWVAAFVTKPDDLSMTLRTKEMTPANYLSPQCILPSPTKQINVIKILKTFSKTLIIFQ